MGKPKLNEVIAVVSGKKSESQKELTDIYHVLQKEVLFDGLSRSYKTRTEEGEPLPPERKIPQMRVQQLIAKAQDKLTELMDLVLTLDVGNCGAKASVEVDGQVLLPEVPATTLLFLEKQLNDVETFVTKIPTPDPAEKWQHDNDQDCLATAPTRTTRSKKIPKAFVKYDATKEHPAQVEVVHEDVIVGDWTTIQYTGRLPAVEKNAMLERVRKLKDAVKVARERANGIEVDKKKMGRALLDYVFKNGNGTAPAKPAG